jgi:hypothetical protein
MERNEGERAMATSPRQKSKARRTATSRRGSARESTTAPKSPAPRRDSKVLRKRRSPAERRADAVAMHVALARIVVPKRPQPIPIPCSTAMVSTSGTAEYENAYTRASPDFVILILNGFTLGIGVPVTYTKTASGWSFEGWRPGCYLEKCSNGAASTEQVWVDGTIDTTNAAPRLTMNYEYHALCNETVTCIETGTYTGDRIGDAGDPRDADYRGETKWKHDCCPDQEWKFSIFPPPPSPGVHGRTVEGTRGPKRKAKGKGQTTSVKERRVAKRRPT